MIHGELEPSAPAGTYTRGAARGVRGAWGSRSSSEDGAGRARHPAQPRVRQPGPARRRRPRPGPQGPRRRAAVQERRADRQPAAQRALPGAAAGHRTRRCLDGPPLPECFAGVVDLGAIDIERGRDHGMPLYNDLRRAFGLAPKSSFTAITGESTESFPHDPLIDCRRPAQRSGHPRLRPAAGHRRQRRSRSAARRRTARPSSGVRRTTLAARLKAIYGDVEQARRVHRAWSPSATSPGSEFGELQRAMWKRQFEALRDGDRFFYLNDPVLREIEQRYGITLPQDPRPRDRAQRGRRRPGQRLPRRGGIGPGRTGGPPSRKARWPSPCPIAASRHLCRQVASVPPARGQTHVYQVGRPSGEIHASPARRYSTRLPATATFKLAP